MRNSPVPLRSRARAVLLLASFCALAPTLARSQSAAPWRTVRQDHLWLATFIDQPITTRWAFLGDVQWRRTDGVQKPQQLLTRGSITYRVTPGFRLGAGLNYLATAPYGELPSARPLRDRQIFYIAQINQKLAGVDVMHRYRFENRWLADVLANAAGDDSLSDSRFAQRARYMLRGSRPLGGLTLRTQPVIGIVQNEMFVGISRADRGVAVDQNRFSFGAGLPLSTTKRLDVLWLQQWIPVSRARASENNRTLWIVLNHTGKGR
ncbi:DUF2490 domain-containing protein [Gemmatimonas sp.]|uniref:DUF2490 domain-containing protein n=1 Tax=Gemmatimonas sp. TaxID=1962908 RepID=UPI00286DD9B1|nr:DUF2490 domain-containing protein [Gemmatimonas sp.]